ncbi:MAG: FG-GAP repeat domain-containing protein [Bacteroidota bacterium]
MTSADFSNNGEQDIIVAQGSSIDQLTLYRNAGNANFSKTVFDQEIDDPITIDYGDFDNDGWTDLIVLTQSSGQIYYYSNDNGTLQNRTAIGTVQSFGKVAVADLTMITI